MSLLQTLAVAITTLISSIPLHDLDYIRTLTTKVIDGIGVIASEYSVYEKQFPPQKTPEEFDFVIVGASPSGSVIANRLSEIEGWNVLLLEAGGTPSFLPEIPLADITFYSTVYNWGTHAEQQPSFCFGCLNNKTAQFGHGKVLGGGSVINFMIFNRGNKMDYDTWEAMGNSGWSYKDVLPYFLKLEDANVAVNDSGYRSKGGPLGVSDISFRTKLTDVFVDAAQEAGFPYVDYNGKEQIGVSYIQATLRNGLRSEAENSYLRPVRHKRNLKIRTGAHVTKILVRPDSKEAYGVEYRKNGVMYKVLARKEVILSAGGLNSPQVLMLSGIGPKDHLEEMGISVIKDLPVGETLYDHVAFIGAPFLVDQHIGLEPIKAALAPKTYVDFILHRKGVIASSVALEAVAYLQTNLTDLQSTWPDIELLFVPATAAADFGIFLKPMLNINDEIYNAIYKPLAGKPSFMVSIVFAALHESAFMILG
nr:unnamed protein product [Callosobruchus chinensis]